MTDRGPAPIFEVPGDRSDAISGRPDTSPVTPIGERVRQFTFGPSAIVTPANGITVARLLATPVVVAMVAMHGAGWAPFAVAFTIGATDGVDGWLARRQGTTRSGAFLDPLADKAVVLSLLSSWPPRASSTGCPLLSSPYGKWG